MPRLPLTIALIRFAGTWMSKASRFIVRPKSCRVSLRISPGWMGFSLLVVFCDLDMLGIVFSPHKANTVLIVDANAVLSLAITSQSFQSVARRDQQIGQFVRSVQCG